MNRCDILDVKKTILEDNDADANLLRENLRNKRTFYMNVMSSPGAGKTTTILATIKALSSKYKVGVLQADIDSDVDALTILNAGFPCIQLHTGGMCHLDADMSRQAIKRLYEVSSEEHYDVIILENVGNLVCPAEFDTGASMDVVILSVPEGDDKPLKYPLVFEKSEAVIINKIDALPVFDFDMVKVHEGVRMRNQTSKVFPVSALNGDGMDAWYEFLMTKVEAWQNG
ncbi:MAG: hydrogenase nickel incorporation protein HypB [Saccharofermentans sp.]|nr:hydrogenase nickel incorporation protein HypB [Saccharofermentans sp.]